jgi:hypothetical protein
MIELRYTTAARLLDRKTWWCAFWVCTVLVAAWPSGAHAQINPFRGNKGPTLSKEDLGAGRAAADKLLTDDHGEVGKSEEWTGPTSGNHGTISVQRAFKRQGRDCRALRSDVRYKKIPGPPRTLNLDVCRLQTGEWKLM